MAAGVLGRAIARTLQHASGRFYVQLPRELKAEALALAAERNAIQPFSAIIIAPGGPGSDDPDWVVHPDDLLAWRTADDRVFVILGGAIEPDSSFATSAVPFLTSAFPGSGGGTCTPAELAAATVETALACAKPGPEVLDAFRGAAPWVFRLLGLGLQSAPRPTRDWGQSVMDVWSDFASELEDSAAIAGGDLRPWDAWELVRLSGFPRPLLGGERTDLPPDHVDVDDGKLEAAAETWRRMVEDYVRPGEAGTILERLAGSSAIPNSRRWTGLDWKGAAQSAQRFAASPPEIGRPLFHRAGGLRDPIEGTADSWHAVTLDELRVAMAEPGTAPQLVPGHGLLPLPGEDGPWLVDMRAGFQGARAKGMADRITLALELSVEGLRPAVPGGTPVDGEQVIASVSATLKPKTGTDVRVAEGGIAVADGRLRLSLEVDVDAKIRSAKPVRWAPVRRLAIEVQALDIVGGVEQPARQVPLAATLIIPSPYWPTVLAAGLDGPPVSPAADVQFELPGAGEPLSPVESPELAVERPGTGQLLAYDGRWDAALHEIRPAGSFEYTGGSEPTPAGGFDFAATARLVDDAVVRFADGTATLEATVVRVEDQSALPTNPLRREKAKASLGEPSRAQREAPLGQFQTQIAMSLASGEWNPASIGQLVIASGLGELPATLSFERLPTAAPGAGGPWPGLGDGPSAQLAGTPEWSRFVAAAIEVAAPALHAGTPDWLSSMDLVAIDAAAVRNYLEAHRSLVLVAEGDKDAFWARYPFSVFLVQGGRGPERGTLQAIFLSPMHPVRLGWLFGAQLHAEAMDGAPRLMGLVDGWNYPAAGLVPGPAGIPSRLVALPLDPGVDGDMSPWSALVPTTQHGIVRPPLLGAGSRLPWGGRSGLNEQVVVQSLDDYRRAHPFLSSLQVELRTAVDAPRSPEVDRAVLAWASDNAEELGGSVRILDSVRRLGEPPDRDSLPERPRSIPRGRFAWTVLGQDEEVPGPIDVAFVENAAPFTHVVEGRAAAPVAPLPVRRFPVAERSGDHVEYHHAGRAPDLLGLGALLDEVEPPLAATRIVTTVGSIQAGADVRWEVIGDINMEPSQMAEVAAASGDGKQLWEWRPGWVDDRGGAVRGAHYVLAKAPRSLVAGLERNLGLQHAQATELLAELGTRGVGLATLRRPGTSQEGEAAGLFYTARLLAGFRGCALPPAWLGEHCYAGLVPLDPLDGVIQALSDAPASDTRADLGLVIVRLVEGRAAALKIVPIECKHRGVATQPAARPADAERNRAANQALASRERLETFQVAVATASGRRGLLLASGRLQAFAALVDLAMKFGPDEPSPEERARVVQDIIDGAASLEVGSGLVIWSLAGTDAPGVSPIRAGARDDGLVEIEFAPGAAAPLAWSGQVVDARHRAVRAEFDAFLRPRLGIGEAAPLHEGLRSALELALGLAADPAAATEDLEERQSSERQGPTPEAATVGEAAARPRDVPESGAPQQTGPAEAESTGRVPGPPEATTEVALTPPDGEISPAPQVEPGEDRDTGSAVARADVFLGAETSTRYSVVGKLPTSGQVVGLDLDHPKALGVFGYMGSGKSYLLGNLIEAAAVPLQGLNELGSPLAVVVFNYRRNAADRFELGSLATPNDEPADVAKLEAEYGARPGRVSDLRVLCLPGELRGRETEYEGAAASELYFKPSALDVEDWELLMGEPGSDAVFARTIRTSLQDLRRQGAITVDAVRGQLEERLQKGSLSAAELRLEAVDRIVSETQGVDFAELLAPGRVLVIDLRQPMFNRDDAMKLILVCANQIAKQRTAFNKLVVFDEAHEYMTEAFGARFDARIRYMRHEGSSYIFATQDVASVPVEIRRHLGTNFVFSLETRDNINDMARAAPEFAGLQLQHLEPGTCYVTSSKSTGNLFRAPRLVRVRPRATRHGGKSQIFHQGR